MSAGLAVDVNKKELTWRHLGKCLQEAALRS